MHYTRLLTASGPKFLIDKRERNHCYYVFRSLEYVIGALMQKTFDAILFAALHNVPLGRVLKINMSSCRGASMSPFGEKNVYTPDYGLTTVKGACRTAI